MAYGDIAFDRAGDLCVAGSFRGDSLRLGAVRVANTGSSPERSDAYVASLSPTGQWQWAIGGGGEADQSAERIGVDSADNILIGGLAMISQLAPPAFGVHTLPTLGRGHGNGYAAKLTNRVWEWAVNITGGGVSELNDLKVDSRGNAYVLSTLEGNRLFVGADTVIGPMTSAGYQGFVAKLSPQGQLRWGVSISSEFDTYVRGVALDSGKLFVTGGVAGDSLRFGPFALNQITDQGFTAALDTAGNWRWAIAQGGALTVDLRHQLDYTGAFADSLILGSLRLTNPYPQSSGAFVAQLAAPAFIHRFSPSAGPAGTLVTLTGVGFASTTAVYFGGVAATFTVLSNGQVQVVVPPGLPTTGPGVLIQIVGPNGTSLSGTRFGGRPTGLTAALVAPHFYLVPNPAHDQVRLVSLPATASTVQVLDALGRVVRTQPAAARSLDVRGLPAGVYVVRAGASTRRLVVE